MPIPTIHVGCAHFAHGRLQAQINSKGLNPVACVDINLPEAREAIASLEGGCPRLSRRSHLHDNNRGKRETRRAGMSYLCFNDRSRQINC